MRNRDEAIVIKRLDFGEADRIITFLTEKRGKISAIAKAVRKPKSKLASGIELFSENEITTMQGRGELETLTSARSKVFYKNILRDLDVSEVAYRFLKLSDRVFEKHSGENFYPKLKTGLSLLDNANVSHKVVEVWFILQLSKVTGNSPNLITDINNQPLKEGAQYRLLIEEGLLSQDKHGEFDTETIKSWRVLLGSEDKSFLKVKGISEKIIDSYQSALNFLEFHISS